MLLVAVLGVLVSMTVLGMSFAPGSPCPWPWWACAPCPEAGGTSAAGSSFIPHFGQWSAVLLTTSGCIGQT